MSGHSKWHSIKHQKAINDAKKGKVFTKLAAEITIASKVGADPSMNAKLRLAIAKAKQANMPNINIDRAIAKGSGANASQLEELTYEAYLFDGVALVIKCLSDNRNRTNADVRTILSKNGATIANPGSAEFLFKKLAVLIFQIPEQDKREDLGLQLIDAGVNDVVTEGDELIVYAQSELLEELINKFGAGFNLQSSEIAMIPDNYIELTPDQETKLEKLIAILEDNEDVIEVFGNYKF